jgi:uncharacterized membrane-anchored protein
MPTKQTKFLLAIALQTVIIFAVIIFKLSVLTGGTEVLLKVEPVDPRGLLRGDYVTFQYRISNLAPYHFRGQQMKNGETVYVILSQGGKYWEAQSAQKSRPSEDEVFIKGRVESGGVESQSETSAPRRFNDSSIRVVYGVEQYFIPEGKGQNFSFAHKEAAAKVAVDENGNAGLKQIYVNDKPWP